MVSTQPVRVADRIIINMTKCAFILATTLLKIIFGGNDIDAQGCLDGGDDVG